MVIYSLVARKGGVGKSTAAANLAALLAGFRVPGKPAPASVLVLDLDQQCHAVRLLSGAGSVAGSVESFGVAGRLLGRALAGGAITGAPALAEWLLGVTVRPAVTGVPIPVDLHLAGGGLAAGFHYAAPAWLAAAALLREVFTLAGFDYVVIDSPPAGILQDFAALLGAVGGLCVVPVHPSALGISGAAQTAALGSAIAAAYGLPLPHPVTFSGWRFFPSIVDSRLSITRQSLAALAEFFGVRWLDTPIPMRAAVGRAAAAGLPVVLCEDGAGDVAAGYGALAHALFVDSGAGIRQAGV